MPRVWFFPKLCSLESMQAVLREPTDGCRHTPILRRAGPAELVYWVHPSSGLPTLARANHSAIRRSIRSVDHFCFPVATHASGLAQHGNPKGSHCVMTHGDTHIAHKCSQSHYRAAPGILSYQIMHKRPVHKKHNSVITHLMGGGERHRRCREIHRVSGFAVVDTEQGDDGIPDCL